LIQDILVTGLVNGGVYALLAIGFSLIFGVARIVNIAHTAFYMLAAYCFYTLLTHPKIGLPFLPAGLIAVAAVTALSVLCYRLVIEPVREHEAAVLIATIALALIFQELMLHVFGGHFLGVPSTLEGGVRLLGVSIPYQRLLILVMAAAMLALVWFMLYRTRLGLAIRATANDLEVANLMGMNVSRVAMATVAISVALAAVAGVVVAPVFVVDPFMWLAPLVTMLAIVVLGGLGSLKGSLIGALIIGYVEAITVFVLPAGAYLKGAVALLIMVAVLLARPEGLFGVAFEEER
jgi:branched-chain amino acid transport system permease protein